MKQSKREREKEYPFISDLFWSQKKNKKKKEMAEKN